MEDIQTVTETLTTVPSPATADVPSTNGAEKPPEIVSDKLAALARKDKGISKRSEELAMQKAQFDREREAFKAEQEAFKSTQSKWDQVKKNAPLDPLKAMEELGLTYEEVTKYILNKEKPTAETRIEMLARQMEEDRAARKAEKEKEEQLAKDAALQKSQQDIADYKNSITEHIVGNPGDYEVFKALTDFGLLVPEDLVFLGIQRVYQDTKKIPTIKEACDAVQEYIIKGIEDTLDKAKYFKEKMGTKSNEQDLPKTPDGATPTLTNSMNSGTATSLPAQTEEERIRRALVAMSATEK